MNFVLLKRESKERQKKIITYKTKETPPIHNELFHPHMKRITK